MLNRRRFIHQVSGGAAALAGSSVFLPASVLGANDRVRFGLIGAGGRGLDIFKHALHAPNTQAVAVADVYTRRLEEAKQLAPTIRTFSDFRRLLDDKSIDASISFPPSRQARMSTRKKPWLLILTTRYACVVPWKVRTVWYRWVCNP